MRRPIPVASVRLANLVLRRQTRPAAPMGRNPVPTAAAEPDCAVKGTPTVTAVPAGISLQAVHPLRFRPGQLPRFALVALLPAPVTPAVPRPAQSRAKKTVTVLVLPSQNAAAVLPQTDHTVFPVTGTNAVKVNWTTWTIIIINVQGKCLTQSNVPEKNTFARYGAALTQALSVLRLKQLEAVSLCISDILTAHAKTPDG